MIVKGGNIRNIENRGGRGGYVANTPMCGIQPSIREPHTPSRDVLPLNLQCVLPVISFHRFVSFSYNKRNPTLSFITPWQAQMSSILHSNGTSSLDSNRISPHSTCPSANGWSGATRDAYDLLPDMVLRLDGRDLIIGDANRTACERLGFAREELLGIGVRRICASADVQEMRRRMDALSRGMHDHSSFVISVEQRRKDGSALPAAWHISRVPAIDGEAWIAVSREPSLDGSVNSASPLGLGLPGHDPLTGLPDRRLFRRCLERSLQRMGRRGDYFFAIFFIDMDGFKTINDRFGHLAGDRVLCEVARRLVGCIRPGDMGARFGGDEFTALIDDVRDPECAKSVAGRMIDQIREPMEIVGNIVQIKASIGVAISDHANDDPDDLLHSADEAMYRVKRLGGDAVGLHRMFSKPR